MSWRLLILRGLATLINTILLASICLILGLGFVAHSESGTRWLFDLARDLAPGELQADSLKGRLTGPLYLTGLSYRDGNLLLEISHLNLDWQPVALLQRRLQIVSLALNQSRLTLPQTVPDNTSAEPFSGLALPLELVLKSVEVTDFHLIQPTAAESVVIEQISLAAQTSAETLKINHLDATALGAQVEVNGNVRLIPTLPLELQLQWRYQLPEGPGLSGQGRVTGNLTELKLVQTLSPPLSTNLNATLYELETAPRWDAKLALNGTDLGAFVADFPARISGRLHTTGSPETIKADGNLKLTERSLGELNTALVLTYEAGSLIADHLQITTPAGAKVEGRGRYIADDAQGVFDADLSWNDLRWPLAGETIQVRSNQGRLKIDGQPADYHYQLSLDALIPDQPALTLEASGNGNTDGLDFELLHILLPEGEIDASGRADWTLQPAWDLNLTGAGINPGLFHPDFPGKLTLNLTSRGQLLEDGPQVEINLARLEGELRGYPIKAKGDLKLAAETLQIDSLALISGSSVAHIDGTAGDVLNLEWGLQADDLASLWPGLSGSLQSEGRLSGNRETPQIHADISGKAISFEAHEVAEFEVHAALDLSRNQHVELDLAAQGLKSGALQWQQLLLSAKGARAAHHIELNLDSQQAPGAQLVIDAGLDEHNSWSGHLQMLALTLPEVGRWDLERPAAFTLAAKTQQVKDLCLAAGEGRLCADFDGKSDHGWKAKLNAPAFPLTFFQQWLPADLALTGRSDLAADFHTDPEGTILGHADIKLPRGALVFELNGEPHQVDFSGGGLQGKLDAKGAHAEITIPLADLGEIEGKIHLPGLNAANMDLDKQPLAGHLKARISDLALASVVAPQLQNVAGFIDVNFTLSGLVGKPEIKGKAELKEGALDIPELGLELRDIGMSINAPTLGRLVLQGEVSSGGGILTLEGETLVKPAEGYPTRLKIKGKDWVAVNIPEAEIHVSPDLLILHNSKRSELDGEIHIPYGRIRPRELPASTVSVTPDLVIVGRDAPQQEQNDPNFHSKLRIIFGDRVSFEGFGLRADLTGNLLLIDEPGRPVIGRGRVGVTDGTYRAYGQDLKIERGYALFADSPVDNPGLDVQAVREAGEVTAGLRVSGTLKTPKLSLYSTPTMTQSEIVSYLLTGHPPGESSGDVSIVAALQAAGVGSLATEAGRQLGLEELRIEAGNSLAEASVVAGTYLSPRLYVQYVNELATRETKLRLRYDLTDKLQIQTETGRSQGVDLFYTIER
ncbi:MAG: translocation/assembly module TamB domain-containing protein [gamma proteobacterium endosymbiont of Lamellibrachia anaximandri]|nr:translocation/assembly module TamB domain-containing protein [gamma proteobacterium endosymbiont of Lamellibrachia anaximandri]MBL3618643.1 translocation/assembly module TamB domain-containing protein [gamma proteobacterium endosymbiont of Lamellibrachia anaximandri]